MEPCGLTVSGVCGAVTPYHTLTPYGYMWLADCEAQTGLNVRPAGILHLIYNSTFDIFLTNTLIIIMN